jgi:hypothetical protein
MMTDEFTKLADKLRVAKAGDIAPSLRQLIDQAACAIDALNTAWAQSEMRIRELESKLQPALESAA